MMLIFNIDLFTVLFDHSDWPTVRSIGLTCKYGSEILTSLRKLCMKYGPTYFSLRQQHMLDAITATIASSSMMSNPDLIEHTSPEPANDRLAMLYLAQRACVDDHASIIVTSKDNMAQWRSLIGKYFPRQLTNRIGKRHILINTSQVESHLWRVGRLSLAYLGSGEGVVIILDDIRDVLHKLLYKGGYGISVADQRTFLKEDLKMIIYDDTYVDSDLQSHLMVTLPTTVSIIKHRNRCYSINQRARHNNINSSNINSSNQHNGVSQHNSNDQHSNRPNSINQHSGVNQHNSTNHHSATQSTNVQLTPRNITIDISSEFGSLESVLSSCDTIHTVLVTRNPHKLSSIHGVKLFQSKPLQRNTYNEFTHQGGVLVTRVDDFDANPITINCCSQLILWDLSVGLHTLTKIYKTAACKSLYQNVRVSCYGDGDMISKYCLIDIDMNGYRAIDRRVLIHKVGIDNIMKLTRFDRFILFAYAANHMHEYNDSKVQSLTHEQLIEYLLC